MPTRYRNIFLFIGVAAVVVMLWTFDMSWDEVVGHVRRAGIWFPAVVLLWLPIYMMNALAWQIIINNGQDSEGGQTRLDGQAVKDECDANDVSSRQLGYWRVLKYTISGYSLNSVTPVGLLGGEPYRIMELSPLVGRARAASSVILYAMMHIFSHFCFWLFSVGLFLVRYGHSLSWPMVAVLLLIIAFCLAGVYFFQTGYRHGLAMRTLRLFSHWPLIGSRIERYMQSHAEGIQEVDNQIAALHAQRRTTFYGSLFLEFAARMVGCLEIQFILFIFTSDISYWDCVLMQAFASLFANLFFFIPMQMGSKEGGLAIVTDSLHMNAAYGVLTGLITRLRELIWVAIGLALIRFGNKNMVKPNKS